MSCTSERAKLAELRARTDRELIALIDREMERARAAAEQGRTEAETAYAEAVRLLPLVYNLAERRRLERRTQLVREMFEMRPPAAGGRAQSAAAPC
jgi:hypothetical protein